jgi:hypothetical protein
MGMVERSSPNLKLRGNIMKDYYFIVKLEMCMGGYEADSEFDAKLMLKDQFEEEYNIKLKDDEIESMEEKNIDDNIFEKGEGENKKVVIEILGGVAEVTECPEDIDCEIIDHD